MKKILLTLFSFLLISGTLLAQLPEERLSSMAGQSPIEKAYLHFDRENYLAGETAWFKAYLYSDYQPDTISTTLYVELLKDSSTIIGRTILPVFLGTANGQFELPDSLATGTYTVRAYSPTMLNQDKSYLFQRNIYIYGKNKQVAAAITAADTKVRMEFFPEGGNLVAGFTNTVAFKATDHAGIPVSVSGTIHNGKGEQLAAFSSFHDGMGMFELQPVSSEKYYARLSGVAGNDQYWLPATADKGIAVTVIPHPQGQFFELQQRTGNPAFEVAYMIGQMQHHVVFRQNFVAGKSPLQGVINTQQLHSGILQITFFNKDHMPLAERLCFVNNKEYQLEAELKTDTIDFSARGRNVIRLQLKDTVQGSFSVSVVDDAYNQYPARQQSIVSSLLLTSDIKGYVHNPAYYFLADSDSVKTALDLVMMTNGWRRFKWESLLAGQSTGVPAYKDNRYISITGKAYLQQTKKPFAEKQLLLFITGAKGKRTSQFMQTDRQGNFMLDSMVFFDKTRLLFSDVRGKKSQYIDIELDGDSVRRTFAFPFVVKNPVVPMWEAEKAARWKMDWEAIQKANGLLLEEVTLKVQKKNPLQQVEDNYTSGLFSGDATKSIDLVNSDEAMPYQNIFDYLQARVNGLQISADGFDYSLYYRQGSSISSMGAIPMALFLDEVETDAAVIATIPAYQVALVKVYSTFAGGWGNSPGGVLAVYTKKGDDYNTGRGSLANHRVYNGYTIMKEFYSPDYSVQKETNQPDNRITLLWRPSLFINSINPVITLPFYNSDRTRQYKVVVEGLTMDGKMLSIEKLITPALKSF